VLSTSAAAASNWALDVRWMQNEKELSMKLNFAASFQR